MKVRRSCVLALLGVLIVHFAAESQQAAVPRIGVIALGSPTAGTLPMQAFDSFRQGLRELGYLEGRTIIIESRWDEGRPERNAVLAGELIRLNVDVIVASTPAATAAAKATKKIPIVMASAGADPVTLGLAASLSRPGGNVTGLTLQNYELPGKRLELLKEALPGISRVILFWDPVEKPQRTDVKEYQRAARSLGLELQAVEVSSPDDFDGAFQSAVRASAHAVIMHQGTAYATHRATLASIALKSRLPTMSGETGYAQNGGLMNYGPNIPDSWRRAAGYVDISKHVGRVNGESILVDGVLRDSQRTSMSDERGDTEVCPRSANVEPGPKARCVISSGRAPHISPGASAHDVSSASPRSA